MSAFFIGGGCNNVDWGLLGRLDGALLLDYDAKDEIGAVLPHRLVPSILIGDRGNNESKDDGKSRYTNG